MATTRLDADLQGTPTDQTKYHSMIRGLMYLTASRPDIAFATFDFGFELIAYLGVDHAGCHDDCKIMSGGLQFLGEKLVRWSSKKQDCTVMSTAEAEYVSLSACCAQVIWMRTQLLDYGYRFNKIPMYCDSKSVIAISCNPVQHSHTKHINIQYHFIKENVKREPFELYFIGTERQLVDLFTKALSKEGFEYLVHRIDDFRRVFQLPQATDNNNAAFVDAPTFSDMLPFFRNELGFSLPMRLPTHFVTKGLPQPWQTLGKIFARCLTTRVTGHDQPPFQIKQMIYCFINNVHVDYAELLWEGLHYCYMSCLH
ncbi:hypothetical protein Tco_0526834 [Tanacetum coccineum]